MDEPLKRLATRDDNIVSVPVPVNDEMLSRRFGEYLAKSPREFALEYIDMWARPTEINYLGTRYDIQFNFCANPLCKWFGMPQIRFNGIKNKPYRYRLVNAKEDKGIRCNPDPLNTGIVPVLDHKTTVYSNWAIAEEIARLATHSTIVDLEPDYEFHKLGCPLSLEPGKYTPFTTEYCFYKWGETKAKCQRFKCKQCGKLTNVLPSRRRRTNFDQNKNELLVRIAGDILGRTPVKKTINALGIGVQTYYDKLEWIYRRCLEFLHDHETKALKQREFKHLRLSSDQLIYHLNFLRQKRKGPGFESDTDDPNLSTSILATCDDKSRYVFRVDVNYDWEISLDAVATHTELFKDDHLHNFARRFDRLRDAKYYPQPPTLFDTEDLEEYGEELQKLNSLRSYIPGLHTDITYTAIAHLWLIRQLLNVKEWSLVSDCDGSLVTAMSRVFAREIADSYAQQYIYKIDRTKDKRQAKRDYGMAKTGLVMWARSHDISTDNLVKVAVRMLAEELERNSLYAYRELANGIKWPEKSRFVRHPLATEDQGYREVTCITPMHDLSPKEVASRLISINSRATDKFFQLVRRSLNFLERPLVGARAGKKSYIYANQNPKYAHQALTILRTWYNFCLPQRKGILKMTPAQRLGIADKVYSMEDILYYR